jgi:hypothetical protein
MNADKTHGKLNCIQKGTAMIHRKTFKIIAGLALLVLAQALLAQARLPELYSFTLPVSAQTGQDMYLPLVNSTGPTPPPTPMPTPYPDGVYILDNATAFVDADGRQHFVGEVFNNTDEHLQTVQVTVNLYDEHDLLITSGTAYTPMFTLPARARTCFNVAVYNPGGTGRAAFADPAYWAGSPALPPLRVLNNSGMYDPATGAYVVSGLVRSEYSATARYVLVTGTLYDAHSQVIGCDFAFVDSTDLAPGQTSPFEITFSGWDYAAASGYHLQVDGNP